MKKLVVAILAGVLAMSMLTPASAKPLKVMTDMAGDAGNQDSGVPGADQAGFDLVGATIEAKGANLEFTVEHAAMPSSGTLPEGFRFMWHFVVNSKSQFRFTAKSADIGKPDPIAGSGTERVGQVDLDGVFRLETCSENPTPAITLINCATEQELDGKFDPAAKTFTIVLPMKFVKAKAGSTISGGSHWAATSGCMLCWVPHYAERSLTPYTIIDSAAQAVVYKVPK